jgi:hypothetical protein
MSDDDTAGDDDGRRQLRLLGAGFVLSGLVTLGLANASDPRGLLVAILGFLGFAALVLEQTQGYTMGVSIGLLSGGLAVWAWPIIRTGDAGFTYLGVLMIVVGLVNVVFARVGLYFRQLGQRLGERTTGKE